MRVKMTEIEATKFFNVWYYDPDFVRERNEVYERYNKALEKELNGLKEKYRKKHLEDFLKKERGK